MDSLTFGLIVGVISLLAYWVWRSLQVYKTFDKLGIPGPRPLPVVGTTREMLKLGFCTAHVEWRKQYGDVYGTFNSNGPALVVSDLDLLQEVFVKSFANFRNRMRNPFLHNKPWEDGLLNLKDDHWKHVRSSLSPAFSTAKLKKMAPAIDRVVQNMTRYTGKVAEKGEAVELKHLASCFAMDVIAGVAFGMQVDTLSNPEDPFKVNGMTLVNPRAWYIPFLFMFPSLIPVLRFFGVSIISLEATAFFMDILDMALKERRQDSKSYPDFLQLLVDAEKEGRDDTGPVDAEIDHGDQLKTSSSWHRNSLSLTDDEIKGNAILFLFGGIDTVSKVLSFTLFLIAGDPDVLRKVQEEVDTVLGKNAVTYEKASQLTYLDMCMNEAIRMFPPGFILDRVAAEDMMLGDYQVKKGMTVLIPAYAIQNDPRYWPDPYKFDPERHTPEAKAARHPFSFMPFGLGPRNCIAQRLAQLEIRMVIAAILQNYTPVMCDKSVYPPVLKPKSVEMAAKDELWVKFEPRG